MFIRSWAHVVYLSGSLCVLVGCGDSKSTTPIPTKSISTPRAIAQSEPENKDHAAQGHSHERGKMLIADAGPYHALLTAHLAASGNELDIFFETPNTKDPKPVAMAFQSFDAQATTGEGESQTLTFEPAPAEERPAGETAGTYSHFIAMAPWMKPDDELLVVAKFAVDGKAVAARWKGFVPRKFAHHAE